MCQAKVGNRKCKRKKEPFCHQHQPVDIALPLPLNHLSQDKKIIKKIQSGPSKSDGPGFIYVYYVKQDVSNFYYKIGRTKRAVNERLKEWKDAQLKQSYAVEHEKHAEYLIHKYLDGCRVYRYRQDDDTYRSVWKATGEPVTTSDEQGKRIGIRKEVEWFRRSWSMIQPVVERVVEYVNV